MMRLPEIAKLGHVAIITQILTNHFGFSGMSLDWK